MNTKPGTKTTEFWVALAPVFLGLIDGVKGDSNLNQTIIICATCLGGLYILSRTLVKWKK